MTGREVTANPVLGLYRRQAAERRRLLKALTPTSPFAPVLNSVLVPEVRCSSMARLGTVLDGGKWVCNPQYLPTDNCAVYAIGLNNEISFEEELQSFTQNGCALRAIDRDIQLPKTLGRLSRINATPFQAFIAPHDDAKRGIYSFASIVKQFNDSSIEVLKFDAEGAELLVIGQVLQVPACQFLVEVHSANSAIQTYKFLEQVSKAGFYLFFSEPNAFHPNLREYSFIHETCLERYHVDIVYGKYLS